MGGKNLYILREMARLYSQARITRASAALSYYLTMTFFPLIICLYSLLGSSYDKALYLLSFAEQFMAVETIDFIGDFLRYVSENNSPAMLAAGLTVLFSSASSAVRSLQDTIGELQGGQRFEGVKDFAFSFLFSFVFLAAMYFAILVMLTGQEFLNFIESFLPFLNISRSWDKLRFLLLAATELIIIKGAYEASKRPEDDYATLPGAIAASIAMVVMSMAFSVFIGESARYPLVYGSIASIILLMFWLQLCCLMIFVGAILNVVLRDRGLLQNNGD